MGGAAGASGRNIGWATGRSPARRLPMAADFRTRSICRACSGVMSGRHRRGIGNASAGRPRDEVIGALSHKGIESGIALRQANEPEGVGDRKIVVEGKRVSVSVERGDRRSSKNKK